ncbi:hypothetical protein SRHO_G00204880 [Serrasalmus rhombeus]
MAIEVEHWSSGGSASGSGVEGFLQACVDRRSLCWPSALESICAVATSPPPSLGTEAGSRQGKQVDNQDSGQQGTGWVQGRGRGDACGEADQGVHFPTRGVLLSSTYSPHFIHSVKHFY